MADPRDSRGPLQVITNDPAAINDQLRQIRDELDELHNAPEQTLPTVAAGAGITVTGTTDFTVAAQSYVYDRVTAATTISNSAAETSIYSKTITGGDLGTNKRLRLTVQCLITDTNAALTNRTLTFRLKYGGSTIATGTLATSSTDGASVASIGTSHGYTLAVLLSEDGTTSAQVGHLAISGRLTLGNLTLGNVVIGAFTAATTARGTGAADATADQTFQVTAQWSVADVGCIFTVDAAALELV